MVRDRLKLAAKIGATPIDDSKSSAVEQPSQIQETGEYGFSIGSIPPTPELVNQYFLSLDRPVNDRGTRLLLPCQQGQQDCG